MTKKDIAELKKRLSKSGCTFTRMSGCYVDCNKEIILKINENFLNLEEEEFFKYMDIAKKVMSGTVGNNILELEFPMKEEENGGKQQFLRVLKADGLKNEALLDRFYELVIENYEYAGNYLILLFHDVYDVMTKTSDNLQLDESEEVYEYILCAICPVELSKAGLGYLEGENRIGPRIRDWVVGMPENGFIFPAFSDRSADIHSIIYYTKNTKNPDNTFVEEGLGCISKKTATEQKEAFHAIVKNSIAEDEEKATEYLLEIEENINDMIIGRIDPELKEQEPIVMSAQTIHEILEDAEIPEESAAKIETQYTQEFGDILPVADTLIDVKAIDANVKKKKQMALVKEVEDLKQEIDEKNIQINKVKDIGMLNPETENCDIFVKVKPDKVSKITAQVVNGKKCIIIPLDEYEQTAINGVNTIFD